MNEARHLSSETLDLLLLSSLEPSEQQEAHAHLEKCIECRGQWEERQRDHLRFQQFVFPRTVDRIRQATSAEVAALPRWRLSWLVPQLGGALACVLLVVTVSQVPSPDAYLGIKGGPRMDVVAKRGPEQFLATARTLRGGDQLRFVLHVPDRLHVLVAARDARGQVSIYFPYGAERSATVDAGRIELPGSIALDDVPGPELVYAVFSKQEVRASSVRTALLGGEPLTGVTVVTRTLQKDAK